jgi:urea transport system permease protein
MTILQAPGLNAMPEFDGLRSETFVLVNFAKTWFTGALPELWLFALGLLFILVTIFLPKGILGTAGELLTRLRGKPPAAMTPQTKPAE